jgi:hypothetical protein
MIQKILYDPKRGKVLQGVSQHALMVKGAEFDKLVRAIFFVEKNVVYFRFYDPTGEYANLSSWAAARSRNVCERALEAFKVREVVPENVKPLYWETGYGVSEFDIKY